MEFIDLLINGILVLIMLGIGFSLSFRSFTNTFQRPKAFMVGLFLQIILLPVLAFTIVAFSELPDAFKVGIVILSACPGGVTSNFLSYLLGGNPALSISLTVTNSFLAPLTIPIIVNLAIVYFLGQTADLKLGFWVTAGQIFSITIIPVTVGILLKSRWPAFAMRAERILRWLSLVLLALLFLIKFFASENMGGAGMSTKEVIQIFPFSLLVNLGALLSGYAFAKLFQLGKSNQLTLGVEVGIQNTSLGFLIAGVLLGNEDMLKPSLVYAMFTFFTAFFYAYLLRSPNAILGRSDGSR